MANTVRLKRSAVQGKAPVVGDLSLGELAVNTYDGKLYTKKNDGSDAIVEIGGDPSQWTTSGSDIYYNTGNVATTGTSTAASFIPTSSTVPTNGIYLPSANNVALATNGTGRLFVDSVGNVGIGTALPVNSTNYVNLALSDTNGGLITFMQGATQSADIIGGSGLFLRTLDASPITFRTNGSNERMRVTSDGKVGVGTSSPGDYTFNQLVVAATGLDTGFTIVSDTDRSGAIAFADGTASAVQKYRGRIEYDHADDSLGINTAASRAVTIDSSQRVGIGTTSPGDWNNSANQLVISNADDCGITIDSTSSTGSNIHFGDGSTGNEAYRGIIRYDNSDDSMRFSTAATERARIDSSGRLLVGTSTSRGDGSTVQIVNDTANPLELFRGQDNAAGPTLILNKSRGSTASPTVVSDGDDVGTIVFRGYSGTASSYLGAARIEGQIDGTPDSGGDTTDMPGRLVFSTTPDGLSSPTERMRISSGGKLTVPGVYSGTTTGGGPVYVESDGDLLRYTSSRKYKTDIETLEDERADAILNCRPVWYRSLSPNDIKTEGAEKSDWGWYGFIAEEVAEVEPRLVNWATKDAVVQEDGSVQSVERDPADYEAEGVRYDNFVPLLLNLVKRQKEQIEAMEARLSALEAL